MNSKINFTGISTSQLYLIFSAIIIIFIVLNVEITVNDDTYVYFNYAKNFANGNYFAYDPRNIASEGFTSLIYLLLLIPFEYAKFPLPIAGFFINSFSLVLSGYFLLKAITLSTGKKNTAILTSIVFVSACIIDRNIIGIIGWAFETLLNLLCFVTMIYLSVLIKIRKKGILSLFVVYFISILVRPENSVLFTPFLIYIYLISEEKKKLVQYFVYFLCGLISFLMIKYFIFNDIFPTGFYRKISNKGALDKEGFKYVKDFLLEYKFQILLILAAYTGLKFIKKDQNFIDKKLLASLIAVCLITILFFFKSNPLIGNYFRYLINVIGLIYILISFIIVQIFTGKKIILLSIIGVLLLCKTSLEPKNNMFSFVSDTKKQIEQHKYIKLGNYFNKTIKNPNEIYFAFGDAGAIPYSFDCNFIDMNGLSEPYIAKLVRNKNSRLKTELYISYFEKYHPDIVVILCGEQNQRNPNLPHGPLQDAKEYRLFLKTLSENGYEYGGSIDAYYELHFAINKNSKNFNQLSNALRNYSEYKNTSAQNGKFIVNFDSGNIQFNSTNTNLK